MRVSLGVRLSPRDQAIHETFLRSVRERLTASELAAASVAGGALSLDQVLADVERTWPSAPLPTGPTGRAADSTAALTRREREVAGLLARGYTDRQIAAALSIAVSTVGVHVHRILAKLGLYSRRQLADPATAQGLDPPPPD